MPEGGCEQLQPEDAGRPTSDGPTTNQGFNSDNLEVDVINIITGVESNSTSVGDKQEVGAAEPSTALAESCSDVPREGDYCYIYNRDGDFYGKSYCLYDFVESFAPDIGMEAMYGKHDVPSEYRHLRLRFLKNRVNKYLFHSWRELPWIWPFHAKRWKAKLLHTSLSCGPSILAIPEGGEPLISAVRQLRVSNSWPVAMLVDPIAVPDMTLSELIERSKTRNRDPLFATIFGEVVLCLRGCAKSRF